MVTIECQKYPFDECREIYFFFNRVFTKMKEYQHINDFKISNKINGEIKLEIDPIKPLYQIKQTQITGDTCRFHNYADTHYNECMEIRNKLDQVLVGLHSQNKLQKSKIINRDFWTPNSRWTSYVIHFI